MLLFDGVNKTTISRKFNNPRINKPNQFSRINTDECICIFFGYWFSDGSFEPISVLSCDCGGGGSSSDNSPNSGGGGSGSGQIAYINLDTSVLIGPKTRILNIAYYLQCFNLSKGATIAIYVDQPIPNSSASWSNLTDPDVGHTFVAIQQGLIRRVYGFYPADGVNPYSNVSDVSQLGEDSNHYFDVSISMPVSSSQLLDIIGYTFNAPDTYNLNSYNCTDFAMNVSALAGVTLPNSFGSWPNGGGNNPGKLGENIRNMQLPSNVTRQITGTTASANKGTCLQQ